MYGAEGGYHNPVELSYTLVSCPYLQSPIMPPHCYMITSVGKGKGPAGQFGRKMAILLANTCQKHADFNGLPVLVFKFWMGSPRSGLCHTLDLTRLPVLGCSI